MRSLYSDSRRNAFLPFVTQLSPSPPPPAPPGNCFLHFFLFSGSGERVPLESACGRPPYTQAVLPPDGGEKQQEHGLGPKESGPSPLSLCSHLCPCGVWRQVLFRASSWPVREPHAGCSLAPFPPAGLAKQA